MLLQRQRNIENNSELCKPIIEQVTDRVLDYSLMENRDCKLNPHARLVR